MQKRETCTRRILNTQANILENKIMLVGGGIAPPPINHSSYQTRNSSGDEIANVNLLYDDIVHDIDSCINSAADRRGYVLEHRFTKFSELTQYNGHYAVQGHSRSPILAPIESSYTTSF